MAESKPQVVVHEDDVGVSHGANVAFAELSKLGICTAGAVMVPCPWFLEVAEMQAKDPRLDIGVHLTLTSEYKLYRWRPLTGASQASGLVDGDGFMWRTTPEVRAHAHPDAVEAELRAQIEAAKTAGIDITHLDSHMFSVVCPEFIDIYLRLGLEERVPVLLVRQANAYGMMKKGPEVDAAIRDAEENGLPVFDIMLETLWERGASVDDDYGKLLERIAPGLTYMALHFNAPGDFEAIDPAGAHLRIEEYDHFRKGAARDRLTSGDYELVGMRSFRDAMKF